MGIVRKVFKGAKSIIGGVTGGLLGGQQPKSPQYTQPAANSNASSSMSAADIAAKEEEDRRKRLLALNAGGNTGQFTQAGGDTSMAPIARKTLLGQ